MEKQHKFNVEYFGDIIAEKIWANLSDTERARLLIDQTVWDLNKIATNVFNAEFRGDPRSKRNPAEHAVATLFEKSFDLLDSRIATIRDKKHDNYIDQVYGTLYDLYDYFCWLAFRLNEGKRDGECKLAGKNILTKSNEYVDYILKNYK